MDYDKKMKQTRKTNQQYLDQFKKWLQKKGLVEKTIKQHLSNADFYLNDYLTYYDFHKMQDGTKMIDDFLGDWFIRKCMWSTAATVKSTAASLKKFYQCMMELGYVKKEDYKELCDEIKESMEYWVDSVERYNSPDFDDEFDFMDLF